MRPSHLLPGLLVCALGGCSARATVTPPPASPLVVAATSPAPAPAPALRIAPSAAPPLPATAAPTAAPTVAIATTGAIPVVAGPERHPAYVRAMSDLRRAHHLLARPADGTVAWDQTSAVKSIDAALGEIQHATLEDARRIDDRPAVDRTAARSDRLRQALALVDHARADIDAHEDDAFANGLKLRALTDLADASRSIRDGIADLSRRAATPSLGQG